MTTIENARTDPEETDVEETDDFDETLVEEISIDGMCGVY